MKLKFILASVGLSMTLAACDNGPQVELRSDREIIKAKDAPYSPKEQYFLGQVQVMTAEDRPGVDPKDSNIAHVIADLKVKHGISASVLDKIPNEPIYLLEVNSLNTVDEVVAALKSDTKRVAMAGRNNRISLSDYHTNDAQLATQWSLVNIGQEAPRSLAGRPGADISMVADGTEGSYDVVVGVIDTGIDYTHEDLAITETVNGVKVVQPGSNIWVNPDEIPGNGLNDDNNADARFNISYIDDVHGYNFVARNGNPMDDQGHGTHVSGTIGALRNNLKGISGIVGKVSLMGLKFLSAEGSGGDFDAQLAIYYAIEMHKRFPQKKFILQNSWGSSGRSSRNGDQDDLLRRAFMKASREGLLSSVAAGNDGTSNRFAPHFPANYSSKIPGFITVAATNNLDQLASFSSYGYDVVQVAAPGTMILSSVPENLYQGARYQAWSGTSMATPHVSGLAAAIWAKNPSMTADEVVKRIENTVDVLPQLHGAVSTSGRINVKRALAGDLNVNLPKVYEEIPKVVQAPRGDDRAGFESMTKLKVDGAKEIAVCFSQINLADNMDWLEIMGSDYRVRDTMTGTWESETSDLEQSELCSAPILGDTVYLRLASEGGSGSLAFETKYLKVVQGANP